MILKNLDYSGYYLEDAESFWSDIDDFLLERRSQSAREREYIETGYWTEKEEKDADC